MKSFIHNSRQFELLHINEDDSRIVVSYDVGDGATLLKFDSSLNITGDGDEHVGNLTARENQWHLIMGPADIPLGVPCNDYGWREMVLAEVEAAKLLLG